MRCALIAFALAWGGCSGPPPVVEESKWGPECEGTEAPQTCFSLKFSLKQDLRTSVPGDLKGTLHWAVYTGGDVGPLGPGSNKPLKSGEVLDADFAPEDAAQLIHLPDMAAGRYQILGYLDDDASGNSNSGDVGTFPKDPFGVPAERPLQVNILLDYVR